MFVCEETPSVYTPLVSFISFLRKFFPFFGFSSCCWTTKWRTPVTVGRWMAIRKSRERDVFVFFLSWKVFRRGCIIYSFGTELLSARLSLGIGWPFVPADKTTKQNKKTTSEWQDFPLFLSTACQRATKVGRPAIFRVETFFHLKRDEWKFRWNIFLSLILSVVYYPPTLFKWRHENEWRKIMEILISIALKSSKLVGWARCVSFAIYLVAMARLHWRTPNNLRPPINGRPLQPLFDCAAQIFRRDFVQYTVVCGE